MALSLLDEIDSELKGNETLLPKDGEFWVRASEPSLDSIWSNEEDDVYGQLSSGRSGGTHVGK